MPKPPAREPVRLRIAHVSFRDHHAVADVGLTARDRGPPAEWVTVTRGAWPGRWPPRCGEWVEVIPAVVVGVVKGVTGEG